MIKRLALALAFIAWAGVALAQFFPFPGPGRPGSGGGGYVGPGDVVGSALGWWGLRGYNTAYATGSNPAAVVCDTATFATCSTINILSNGNFDTATASGSAACATACVVKSLTDQSGNGHNATCASAATCPTLTFSCRGSNPCMTFANNQPLTATGPASTAQPYTFVVEFKYTVTTNTAIAGGVGGGGGDIGLEASNTVVQYFATNVQSVASTVNTQYDWSVVFNGAACASNLAGSSTTGTNCGTSAISSGGIQIGGDPFSKFTGQIEEMGIWGSAFNTTQQTSMHNNLSAFW